jgi:radical SAM protein with 4Fe4S-binding SPASM domain
LRKISGAGIAQADDLPLEAIAYVKENHPELGKEYEEFFTKGTQFSPEFFARIPPLVEEAQKILAGTGVDVAAAQDRFQTLSGDKAMTQKCLASSWITKIDPRGKMYLCVESGMQEKFEVGDLKNNTLDEVWEGKQRHQVLDRVNGAKCSEAMCKGCMMRRLNWALAPLEGAKASVRTAIKELLKMEKPPEDQPRQVGGIDLKEQSMAQAVTVVRTVDSQNMQDTSALAPYSRQKAVNGLIPVILNIVRGI